MLAIITKLLAPYGTALAVRDGIEILFFSSVIYYFQLWLRKDTEHNLLDIFYLYCFLFFGAHYVELPVMRIVLFLSAPAMIVLFLIFHQETLQKNFVKLSKGPPLLEGSHWVDELIKCCLMAVNRHKEIILVIERNDHLKSLIHAPYYIYAELKKDVFDILLEKHKAGNDTMIWINQQGKMVAINSTWRNQIDETWISSEAQHMHPWKQQSLFITSKTDALVFKINPLARNFDLVTQGRLVEGMKADQIASFLKKYLLTVKKAAYTKPPSEKTL